MISIIDYGVGNLKSLSNALSFLDFESELIDSSDQVLAAEKLILPGVGAFDYAMQNIHELGLESAITEKAKSGTPIIGICLGMQLLLSKSEEARKHSGLGLIPGQVIRMKSQLKVPHMGWNEISIQRPSSLLKAAPQTRYGYFVHSFVCEPDDQGAVVATTAYDGDFVSIIERENIFGTQFHPEKSQELGLHILKRFAEI